MDSLSSYRTPFLVALALHIILLSALFFHFRSYFTQPNTNLNGPIIKAVAVNDNQLASLQPQQSMSPPLPLKPAEKPQQAVKVVEREVLHEQKTLTKPAAIKPEITNKTTVKQVTVTKHDKTQETSSISQQKQQRQKQLVQQKKLLAQQIQQEVVVQQQQQTKQTQQKQLQLAKTVTQQLVQQQLAEAAATSAQTAQNQAELDKYKTMILQAISQQWIIPDQQQNDLQGKLLVRVAPGGMVVTVTITQSSGDDALDRSARTAVFKASPLPVPQDPTLFNQFRELSLTFKPEGVIS